MAFSVNVNGPVHDGSRVKFKESQSSQTTVIAVLAIFAVFCAYDYSPYGYGLVANGLGIAQRWVQYTVSQFRLRM